MYNSFYSTHLDNQQKLKELTQEARNRSLARATQQDAPMMPAHRSSLRIALINALLIFKVR
jgi:hypothetical protein